MPFPPHSRRKFYACVSWLIDNPEPGRPHPLVPWLMSQFNLSAHDACQAMKEASGRSPALYR